MAAVELHDPPCVTHDWDMSKNYLSKKQFAARIGLEGKEGAMDKLRLPEPDVIVGEGPRATRGWSTATVDKWNASRPGTGNPWPTTKKK